MQVTGTIGNVQARIDNNTGAQRFWQAHGKTNYVFEMSINTPTGPEIGEISSQTANVYPKPIGAPITVNVTDGQYGRKFSAVQEQQGQQQPFQQGGQTNYPSQPQQQAPPQNQPRDFDKENRGKCRFGLYAQRLGSGVSPVDLANDRASLEAIEILIGYSMNGLPQAQQPQYGSNPALDQDVPF